LNPPAKYDPLKNWLPKSPQMSLSLLTFLSSTHSQYSISVNFNVSYEWKLYRGEVLEISPSSPGAYVVCSKYDGLSLKVGLGDKEESTINDLHTLVGVHFGSLKGYLQITATKDTTFLVHVWFLSYSHEQPIRIIRIPNDSQSEASNEKAIPKVNEAPQTLVDSEQSAAGWAPLVISIALAICILIAIIRGVRRANHQNYEELDISEDDDLDGYIPAVTPILPPKPAESPYVLCRVGDGGLEPITK
jgi:hypothetical protein